MLPTSNATTTTTLLSMLSTSSTPGSKIRNRQLTQTIRWCVVLHPQNLAVVPRLVASLQNAAPWWTNPKHNAANVRINLTFCCINHLPSDAYSNRPRSYDAMSKALLLLSPNEWNEWRNDGRRMWNGQKKASILVILSSRRTLWTASQGSSCCSGGLWICLCSS